MSSQIDAQMISVDKLIPYKKNARTHSDEQIDKIGKSLLEFGFINPVLIDDNLNIIAGHGRVEASKRQGIKEVPCFVISHLTDEQKRAYIIADNKLAEDAGWDEELLKLELGELHNLGFDIEFTGFTLEDFNNFDDLEDVVEDDFDEPPPDEPQSKLGDIYQLGKHRLMCGDSTKEADIIKLMGDEIADLYVTDPPYNVNYEGGTGLKILNDHMDNDSFRTFLVEAFTQADKQPEGILTKMPEENKKTVVVSEKLIVDVTKNISLIDTGDDSIGSITCVMKRETYYNRFLDYTVNVNSSGEVVGKLPNLTKPYLLGIPIVFSQNMNADEVLFGDFEKYTLIEREAISIDKSEHVKFSNDQTGFRGIGRFDGKPTKPSAFALITIVDEAG